jgi:hypothetical protein
MRKKDASFSVRFLGQKASDERDIDRALKIFIRNTPPMLRTKTNQIRTKISAPVTSEGEFYFAALYRGDAVIGFAMFGYYPRTRLIVFDHMVIEKEQRGSSAFYIFAQLLNDAIENLDIEVDFIAVEIEQGSDFAGVHAEGKELVRLLGQVGFGEVHVEYVIPSTEVQNFQARYAGVLVLRGQQKLYHIRREELLDICSSIFFEHYLPWYADFFGDRTADYDEYLRKLFDEFQARLRNQPIVKINGPEADLLIPNAKPVEPISYEKRTAWNAGLFAVTTSISALVLYFLKTPAYLTLPVLLTLLAVFVGIAASSRSPLDVFDRIMNALFGDRRKSRYQRSRRSSKDLEKPRQPEQGELKNLPSSSTETED